MDQEQATIILRRTSSEDVGVREIYVSIDGRDAGVLRPGDVVTKPVAWMIAWKCGRNASKSSSNNSRSSRSPGATGSDRRTPRWSGAISRTPCPSSYPWKCWK